MGLGAISSWWEPKDAVRKWGWALSHAHICAKGRKRLRQRSALMKSCFSAINDLPLDHFHNSSFPILLLCLASYTNSLAALGKMHVLFWINSERAVWSVGQVHLSHFNTPLMFLTQFIFTTSFLTPFMHLYGGLVRCSFCLLCYYYWSTYWSLLLALWVSTLFTFMQQKLQ